MPEKAATATDCSVDTEKHEMLPGNGDIDFQSGKFMLYGVITKHGIKKSKHALNPQNSGLKSCANILGESCPAPARAVFHAQPSTSFVKRRDLFFNCTFCWSVAEINYCEIQMTFEQKSMARNKNKFLMKFFPVVY